MRIAGITLPNNKRLEVALTAIYGVGPSRAREILKEAKVSEHKRTQELSSKEEGSIRDIIAKHAVEGALKREISGNIKRLKDIQSYRGLRHSKRLPLRGQRTKTNSRTVRGNVRKTMMSGKRKVEKK